MYGVMVNGGWERGGGDDMQARLQTPKIGTKYKFV